MAMSYGYDPAPIESQDARWERLRQRVITPDGFSGQESAIADDLVRVGMQRVREKAEFARIVVDGYREGLIPWSRMMDVTDAAARDMASTSHQCGLDGIPEMDRAIGAACESTHSAYAFDGYLDEHVEELGKSFNDVARLADVVSSDSLEACSERISTAMREVPDQRRMQVAVRSCIEHVAGGGQMGPGLGLRESMGMPRDEGDAWRSAVMVEGRTHDAKAWFNGEKHSTPTRGTVGGLKWDMHTINDLVEDARRNVTFDNYGGVERGDAQRVGSDIGDIAGRFAIEAIREHYDAVVDALVQRRSLEDYVSSDAVERRRYVADMRKTLLDTVRHGENDMPWTEIDLRQRIEEASFDLADDTGARHVPLTDAEAIETVSQLARSMQRECAATGTRRRLGDEYIKSEQAANMVDSTGKGGAVAAILHLANGRRDDAIHYGGDTRVGELVRDAFAQGRDLSEITSALEAIDDIGNRSVDNLEQAMGRLDDLVHEGGNQEVPSHEAPGSQRPPRIMPGRRMPSSSLMPPKRPDSPKGPEAER